MSGLFASMTLWVIAAVALGIRAEIRGPNAASVRVFLCAVTTAAFCAGLAMFIAFTFGLANIAKCP